MHKIYLLLQKKIFVNGIARTIVPFVFVYVCCFAADQQQLEKIQLSKNLRMMVG